MYLGYQYSLSGASIGVEDFVIPQDKATIIAGAEGEIREIEGQFSSGLVTQGEKYNKVIDIWTRANDKVGSAMMETLAKETVKNRDGDDEEQTSFNSVWMYSDSEPGVSRPNKAAFRHAWAYDKAGWKYYRNTDHSKLP